MLLLATCSPPLVPPSRILPLRRIDNDIAQSFSFSEQRTVAGNGIVAAFDGRGSAVTGREAYRKTMRGIRRVHRRRSGERRFVLRGKHRCRRARHARVSVTPLNRRLSGKAARLASRQKLFAEFRLREIRRDVEVASPVQVARGISLSSLLPSLFLPTLSLSLSLPPVYCLQRRSLMYRSGWNLLEAPG